MLELTVLPPVHQEVYASLLAALPFSAAYRVAPVTIPHSTNPTRFILTTSFFGVSTAVHRFFVNGQLQTTVTPDREKSPVDLQLPRGDVEIIVENGLDLPFQLILLTKNEAALFDAAAREIYFGAQKTIDETQAAIASPFNARLIEHHLAFQDLLPGDRAPRTHAVRMAIHTLLSSSGTEQGVRDFITALFYSTPHVVEMQGERTRLDPKVFPLIRQAHDFSGFELHVWFPNVCAFTWVAFVKVLDNLRTDELQLTEWTESQVSVSVNGEVQQHNFDLDSEGCQNALKNLIGCFDSIRMFVTSRFTSQIGMCEAQYPLDTTVQVELGVPLWDDGSVEDDGALADPTSPDPTFDGFIGQSLDGRMDGGYCLDSWGLATRFSKIACCWPGLAVTPLWRNDVSVLFSSSFHLGTYPVYPR